MRAIQRNALTYKNFGEGIELSGYNATEIRWRNGQRQLSKVINETLIVTAEKISCTHKYYQRTNLVGGTKR
jgi:hypothetical protein